MIKQPRKYVFGDLLGIVGSVFDFGQPGEFDPQVSQRLRTKDGGPRPRKDRVLVPVAGSLWSG